MYTDTINFLKEKYQYHAPLAMTFQTVERKYLYDSGTGKVIDCDAVEFDILEIIISGKYDAIAKLEGMKYSADEVKEALDRIVDCIEQENILKLTEFRKFKDLPDHKENVLNRQQLLTLEVTEFCNLRCKYCIYDEEFKENRNFSNRCMSKEIAFRAIENYSNNTSLIDSAAVTFYGGEPLTQFGLIKECVEYAKELFKDKKISFSLTTNLTLVTREIAEYLASIENFSVLCSIDGPQEIHDGYRVDVRNMGTFDRAIRGLKILVDAYGERSESLISTNTVLGPPYSMEKLKMIDDFFKQADWMPMNMNRSVTYPSPGTLGRILKENPELKPSSDNPLFRYGTEKFGDSTAITREMMDKQLLRVSRSHVSDEVRDVLPMNACCMPGERRIFVKANGKYKICEKMGNTHPIGDFENGVNYDFIEKEYIENYTKESIEDCSRCWAAKLCSVCYADCYDENEKFSIEKKREKCAISREIAMKNLCAYYEIYELDPGKLDYLDDIVLK